MNRRSLFGSLLAWLLGSLGLGKRSAHADGWDVKVVWMAHGSHWLTISTFPIAAARDLWTWVLIDKPTAETWAMPLAEGIAKDLDEARRTGWAALQKHLKEERA